MESACHRCRQIVGSSQMLSHSSIDHLLSHEGFQDELIKIPFFGPQASPGTSFDWNYTTVPQQAINNQNIPYPRGYVLGGSSSTSTPCFLLIGNFLTRFIDSRLHGLHSLLQE